MSDTISDQEIKEFLSHHGVKGQKWGITNEGPSSRKDKKWQRNAYKTKNIIVAHNALADRMNNGVLADFNKKYEGKQLIDANGYYSTKHGKTYIKEYNDLVAKHAGEILHQMHGVSPSGKFKIGVDTRIPGQHHTRIMTNLSHAALDNEDIMMKHNCGPQGHITSLRKIKETEMAQSYISNGLDFLEHHGVKGQKWGIRNRLRKTFGFPVRSSQPHGSHDPSNKGSSTFVKNVKKFGKEHREGIILGTKIALTAAFVAASLKADGTRRVKDVPNYGSYTKHAGTVKDVIHAEHAKQASSLLRMHQEGKMDKAQYAHFKKILDARYAKKIMDAA